MPEDPDVEWIAAELTRARSIERAPTHLRQAIGELSARQSARRPVRRRIPLPAVGLIAAILLALVLVLPGGTPGGPTVAQAAAVGAQPISYAPPPHNASTPNQTTEYARFARVRFPRGLGIWNFEGWRIARVDGRRILTIYYAHGDDELSYSVAATPLLRGQRSGFSTFRLKGRTVISWREAGHSCLLSSASLPRTMLLATARS